MSIPSHRLDIYPLRGMDNRYYSKDSFAKRVRDMTWDDREGWKSSGGYRPIGDDYAPQNGGAITDAFTAASVGEITSLHFFSQHNGAFAWMLWETQAGELVYFNGSAAHPTPSTLWTVVRASDGSAYDNSTARRSFIKSPNAGTQSQAWGDHIYLANGYDEPLCFSGRYAERAGWGSTPPAPRPTLIGTMTSLAQLGLGRKSASGDDPIVCGYTYRITFINERGQESPGSAVSNIVTMPNSLEARNGAWVELPIGPAECVARRVYRSQNIMNSDGEPLTRGLGDTHYFLTEIQDNESRGFEDYTIDAQLGSVFDPLLFGEWPTNVRLIASFKNTMFIVGRASSQLLYSRAGRPEMFPVDNVIDVGDGDGGPITGIYSTSNALVVFKQQGCYLIKGDAGTGFYAQTFSRTVGCASASSLVSLPGLGLFVQALDGIYLLEGALENTGTPTRFIDLTPQIKDLVEEWNRPALINSRAEIYHRDKEVWLAYPMLGSQDNNRVLVYHYAVGSWSYRDNFPIKCMVASRDHRGYLFFGSHSADNKGVHVYTRGSDKKGVRTPSDVEPLYETADLDFGQIYDNVRPLRVIVRCIGYGDNDLQLNYRINRRYGYIRDTDQGRAQQLDNDPLPVYGTAVWGESVWATLRPIVLRYDISTGHTGPTNEISFRFTPEVHNMQLSGVAVEVKSGGTMKVKAISSTHGKHGSRR